MVTHESLGFVVCVSLAVLYSIRSKSNALLYLSKILSTFTFNEVLKNGNTFTFSEVKVSPFFSTFTSLQVTLYSLQCSLKKLSLHVFVDFKTHWVTAIFGLMYPASAEEGMAGTISSATTMYGQSECICSVSLGLSFERERRLKKLRLESVIRVLTQKVCNPI